MRKTVQQQTPILKKNMNFLWQLLNICNSQDTNHSWANLAHI